MEDWVEASPGEEADFDEREEDGKAAEAHDCAAAGSVRGDISLGFWLADGL